jgi:hypothetical protein
VVKALLRYYSYLFHGLLAIVLLAIAGVALATGPGSLRLDMLPWSGATLTYIVLGGSIFALLTVALALRGQVRWLFFVWSLIVLGFMIKGYIFSSYYFGGGGLKTAIYLMVGAIIALFGAWFQIRPTAERKYKYK